jgi:ABC-type glycerol-3-phosphate transport system permease component
LRRDVAQKLQTGAQPIPLPTYALFKRIGWINTWLPLVVFPLAQRAFVRGVVTAGVET